MLTNVFRKISCQSLIFHINIHDGKKSLQPLIDSKIKAEKQKRTFNISCLLLLATKAQWNKIDRQLFVHYGFSHFPRFHDSDLISYNYK